jgi:hypothetical protein
MQSDKQKKIEVRTGKKAGIWLAFSFALGLHFILLLLPITSQIPVPENSRTPIELQLTTISSQSEIPLLPMPEPEEPLPEPEPETIPELPPEPPKVVLEEQTEPVPVASEPPALTTGLVARNLPPDMDNMSEPEKIQLTNTILARQFFTEESAADQLFGKPLVQNNTEIQQEFHYPLKQNMVTMLDQPLPDMPFAYTPDLVYFAYEPGVKGDLQRFWDVITPEFGWRTKYGTEVRCILVLVIVGCGWK